jgi:hypothetical protein
MRNVLRLILLGVTTIGLGCHAWRPAPLATPSNPSIQVARARVTLQDGRVLLLDEVRTSGDSLFGKIRRSQGEPAAIAVHVGSVKSIEEWRLDKTRTAALVGGIVVPIGVGVVAVTTCTIGCTVVFDVEHANAGVRSIQ